MNRKVFISVIAVFIVSCIICAETYMDKPLGIGSEYIYPSSDYFSYEMTEMSNDAKKVNSITAFSPKVYEEEAFNLFYPYFYPLKGDEQKTSQILVKTVDTNGNILDEYIIDNSMLVSGNQSMNHLNPNDLFITELIADGDDVFKKPDEQIYKYNFTNKKFEIENPSQNILAISTIGDSEIQLIEENKDIYLLDKSTDKKYDFKPIFNEYTDASINNIINYGSFDVNLAKFNDNIMVVYDDHFYKIDTNTEEIVKLDYMLDDMVIKMVGIYNDKLIIEEMRHDNLYTLDKNLEFKFYDELNDYELGYYQKNFLIEDNKLIFSSLININKEYLGSYVSIYNLDTKTITDLLVDERENYHTFRPTYKDYENNYLYVYAIGFDKKEVMFVLDATTYEQIHKIPLEPNIMDKQGEFLIIKN